MKDYDEKNIKNSLWINEEICRKFENIIDTIKKKIGTKKDR